MRQTKLWMIAAMLTWCGHATVLAQDDEEDVDTYFIEDDMPDMTRFMPGPPDSTSVAYARLHTSERFLEQMKKARDEYKALKGDPTAVVIQNQQKVVRR